jgi:hypothetical protein
LLDFSAGSAKAQIAGKNPAPDLLKMGAEGAALAEPLSRETTARQEHRDQFLRVEPSTWV